jgi:hypothetical protein
MAPPKRRSLGTTATSSAASAKKARQAWNDAMKLTAGATALPPALLLSSASVAGGGMTAAASSASAVLGSDSHRKKRLRLSTTTKKPGAAAVMKGTPANGDDVGTSTKQNRAIRFSIGGAAQTMVEPPTTSKDQRRQNARKGPNFLVSSDHDQDNGDFDDYQARLLLDALEGIDHSLVAAFEQINRDEVDGDDEYDALEEFEDSDETGRPSKKKPKGKPRGRKSSASGSSPAGGAPGMLPKHLRPRSLASLLLEELNRYPESGVAREFIALEEPLTYDAQLPRRKFCPVTHQLGKYREMKSGIYYSNPRAALEQIQERLPPWITIGGNTASYYELVKSLPDQNSV